MYYVESFGEDLICTFKCYFKVVCVFWFEVVYNGMAHVYRHLFRNFDFEVKIDLSLY